MSSCYKYFNNEKNVDGAIEECGRDEGYLVAINDINENEFLKENFAHNSEYISIGALQDISGNWSWRHGDMWQFESWGPDQPYNWLEMCAVLTANGWYKVVCSWKYLLFVKNC